MPDITTLVTTDGHLLQRSGTTITGVDPATLSGTSGLTRLGRVAYNPASIVSYGLTSPTPSAVDVTNLSVTFTAPASGVVWIRLEAVGQIPAGQYLNFSLISGGSLVAGTDTRVIGVEAAQLRKAAMLRITGLTSGTSYTYSFGASSPGGGTVQVHVGGDVGPASIDVFGDAA